MCTCVRFRLDSNLTLATPSTLGFSPALAPAATKEVNAWVVLAAPSAVTKQAHAPMTPAVHARFLPIMIFSLSSVVSPRPPTALAAGLDPANNGPTLHETARVVNAITGGITDGSRL